jgi:hypothetical protein
MTGPAICLLLLLQEFRERKEKNSRDATVANVEKTPQWTAMSPSR